MTQLGQAAMIFTGAALMALAAKERSWRTLGIAAAGAPLLYRGATGRWPVPEKFAQSASDAVSPVPIEAAVTIGKPADELYRFWRQLENLPRFMKNLDSVTESDGRHSHWVGRSPLGFKMEWDAEILDEREGKLLSWRSLPDSDVQNAGTVFFDQAASERGTVVRVSLDYQVPGHFFGQAAGKVLSGITEQQVREDLRRFKELMEAGEVATTEGQPHGVRSFVDIKNPI
ncbi:MAG TPA: SRPBCC family protein [Thermoanaerobaculia bacterium]|jgi:uncharacterized membrane protein|nr:SRPBCC family protein [Thermoanaerobaculia bacterium]